MTNQEILELVEKEGDLKEFEYNGFKCLIKRIESGGHLCGYIDIEKGHWLHGQHYGEIHEKYGYEVHGGLTYSRLEKNGFYRIGFDCAHFQDISPKYLNHVPTIGYQTYKDMNYVKRELESLVTQIIRSY